MLGHMILMLPLTSFRLLCYDTFFFFFSSRRRHTRYWRDWSSDVCSSDLARNRDALEAAAKEVGRAGGQALAVPKIGRASCRGKSVDLGGRRIIKKKKKIEGMECKEDEDVYENHQQVTRQS